MTTFEADVVVVGAGLAGLNAARWSRRLGKDVLVLEARAEVGGRTRSRPFGERTADFGAEWVGKRHRRALALAAEHGLKAEPARNLGHPVRWLVPSGESVGRLPPSSTRRDFLRVFASATDRSKGLDVRRPWLMPAELDACSVAGWLDELSVSADTREIIGKLVGALSSSDTSRLSMLQFLWWMRLAGNPLLSVYTTFQYRFPQGAQQLATSMARQFRVLLDSPVRSITEESDGVTTETESGVTYRTRKAIVAVPLSHTTKIRFEPGLSEPQNAVSRLHMGPGSKVIARLPRGHRTSYNTVIGGDVLSAAWRNGDLVTGFVLPGDATPSDERLVRALTDAFEAPGVDDPAVFHWADESYIPGCDLAFGPGEITRLGPHLREPHGRVHFAGAERSSWPNNMEGALESGEEAARAAAS